jgi:diacylglycerol kinase (ATP)
LTIFDNVPIHLNRLIQNIKYALTGIKDLLLHHRNAQIQAGVAVLVLIVSALLPLQTMEWAVILLCILIVMALEAMNSALEYLTDLVSPDYHPLAGKAKDMAAGAVLLASIGSVIIGLLILGPKIGSLCAF